MLVQRLYQFKTVTLQFQMGQTNNGQNLPSNEYSLVRDLPNGSIVKENSNGHLHFLKEYSFTNQEAYQQAFINFSKKLPEKHQHILYLQRTNTKLQNTFCSTFYKISLLYEYLDHTLHKEIQERSQQRKVFDEKEVWSVLCSCVLGVSEMIRVEGRSHSALSTKDIRLNEEGLVKILSLEMIGMDGDHDLNREGTTKQLAITVLNCLLMEQITNNSQEFLAEIIESLECTTQMKNILRLMVSASTKFVQLEQYLFRMVQQETDSLNSYSNTPNLKQKQIKGENSYSKIPQESKEDDSLMPMQRDVEDNPESQQIQPTVQEQQIPDEDDLDDSKNKGGQSNQLTLREGNTPSISQRSSRVSNRFIQTQNQQPSLFTDPRLLNLIHNDLEEIKKRKSVANSRNLGVSQSKFSLQQKQDSKVMQTQQINFSQNHSQVKQNQAPSSSSKKNIKNEFKNINLNNASSVPTITANRQSSEKRSKVETSNFDSFKPKTAVNIRTESEQLGWNSQKQLNDFCSNPEKKIPEKRVQNIMDLEDMGFKKKKPSKPKEEESRISSNGNSNVTPTVLYNSNQSSHFNEAKIPINTYLQKSRESQSQQSRVSKKSELEYVTENYVRGRYEGTKLNGMRHGKGVFYYNEGGKYIGEWKENKMFGKGKLYYPNNEIAYDGEWKNDQLEGKGTLYNQEVIQLNSPFDYKDWDYVEDYWIKYEGYFSDDSKNGQGKFYLSNGEIFQGVFREDMVWGQGVLQRRDGSRVHGYWKENKLARIY